MFLSFSGSTIYILLNVHKIAYTKISFLSGYIKTERNNVEKLHDDR